MLKLFKSYISHIREGITLCVFVQHNDEMNQFFMLGTYVRKAMYVLLSPIT